MSRFKLHHPGQEQDGDGHYFFRSMTERHMAALEIIVTATAGVALYVILPKHGAAYQPEYETLAAAGGCEIRRYASFRYVEDDGSKTAGTAFKRLKAACAGAKAAHGVPMLCAEGKNARLPAVPKPGTTLCETGPFVVAVTRVGDGQAASEEVPRALARAAGYEPDPDEPHVTAQYDFSSFTPERRRRTERWIMLRPLYAGLNES